MSSQQFTAVVIMAFAIVLSQSGASRADGCSDEVDRFNEAIDAGHTAQAQREVDTIATDALCGRFQIPVQRRLAAMQLSAAQDLMARGRPSEEYAKGLEEAARPGVLWQAAASLAEVRFGERRFAEAALGFDAAIEIVKNETVTPTAPPKFEIQGLIDRAAQARLLEANLGSEHKPPTYIASLKDHRDGAVGGYLSASVRGIVPHALPLPIIFDFDKASLTPVGEDAVRELIRAVREQQPPKIVVVGHTDVRGGVEYNLKLSRDRAIAVAAFMHGNGIDIPIEPSGVGSNDPLKVEDSAGLTADDIYALNRRVEWMR